MSSIYDYADEFESFYSHTIIDENKELLVMRFLKVLRVIIRDQTCYYKRSNAFIHYHNLRFFYLLTYTN